MKHISLASAFLFTAALAAPVAAENLLVPLTEKKWNEAAAVHLLRRAAFEGTPSEVRRTTSPGPFWLASRDPITPTSHPLWSNP